MAPAIARSRRTRALAVATAAGCALALAACSSNGGSSGGSTGGGGDKIGVSLITKDSTNPFFVTMQNGAKEEAAKLGNIALTISSGKADGDEQGQIQAIENSIAAGDKGILITPNGPGVNSSIKKARDQGLYVIALDTPPDPADTVDITFATDNYKAGQLIGKWAAAQMKGKDATIALLDLFNDKVVSVDVNRDQGFLNGFGIDTADKTKNGDEAKSGSRTDGGGNYTIVCNEATNGATPDGKSAMERCLNKNPNINVVYTINEPAAAGAVTASGFQPNTVVVSVDGGCSPGIQYVKDGKIGATSQQYPIKMAQLGVDAIQKIATGGEKPATSPGLSFYDTGVALVTDKTVSGLDSITSDAASKICWGKRVLMSTTATKGGGARESAAQAALSRRAHSPAQRIQHLLHRNPAISPALILVLTIIVFSIINPRFIGANSLSLLVQQTAIIAALAIGQTLIILTAGIDLSVGAIGILCSMVMAKLAADNGVPGVLALLIGVALGFGAGWLNGFLVTRINLPPFIVTLGTLSVFTAIGLLYSGSTQILGNKLPGILTWTGNVINIAGFRITTGVIIVILMYVVVWFALSQTAWGRHVFAVGDDPESARLSGIPSKRVLLSVYSVAGLIYGIAAWVLIGRADGASPNGITDGNLQSITAVVIGGTSLFGGRGGVLGTALGALIVQSFTVGLALAGVDQQWRLLAIGVLVIAAVGVDQWIRKVKS